MTGIAQIVSYHVEEMENGKTVSQVPSALSELDGLVNTSSMEEVSLSDTSTGDDNLPPGMKNRKSTSRQETAESDVALPALT